MPYHQATARESRGHTTHEHRQQPEPLASEKVTGERKTFFLDLLENQRGRMVKISEVVNQRRNTIIVGTEDLAEFITALQAIQAYEKRIG